ncbi:hypothetical protein [Nocardia sp. bgisy118]|uniref:hypothetical protein n=1 Tax=Nocardia sp. bgisy118 TaxID=3413786 RepID=UPI003F4A3110
MVASPHAKVAEDRMLLELDRLLHGRPDEQNLLGLLTAARGGLTATDLAELTDQSPTHVRRALRGVAARTFDTRRGHWRQDSQVYLLGHEDLHATAAAELGDHQLGACRQRLHDWAERYRDLGWPPQTPEYLLRAYHRLLADTDDLPRMIAVATDHARHERMLGVSGGDTTALSEIMTTQDHLLRRQPADLLAMLRLAIHRDHLLTRNSGIPESLPAHWVRRGHLDRAIMLANSITDPVDRCAAMCRVAETVAARDSPAHARPLIDQTETAARNIIDPSTQARALLRIGKTFASIGDLERAEAIASDLGLDEFRAQALAHLAVVMTRTGYSERARRLMDNAETIAVRAITLSEDPDTLTLLCDSLMQVFYAFVQVGDLKRATTIIRAMVRATFDARDFWEEDQLAAAAAEAGCWKWADKFAQVTSYPAKRVNLLVHLAMAEARTGVDEHAGQLLDHAEGIARAITDFATRTAAIADVAAGVARTGDVLQSRSLIADVENMSQAITDSHQQMMVLQKTAAAVTETGDLARAEAVARSIASRNHRAWALTPVAIAFARTGDVERAEATIRDFVDVGVEPHPLTVVAKAIAEAGDLTRAEALARRIHAPYQRERALFKVAVALAQVGDLERAEPIARNDLRQGFQVRALSELFVRFARVADLERAEAISRSMTTPRDQAQLLGRVAGGYARAGDTERAARLFDLAETSAQTIADTAQRVEAFVQLAKVAAKTGDHARARLLIEHATAIEPKIRTIGGEPIGMSAVEVLVQTGDLDSAEAVARNTTHRGLAALPRLVNAFIQAGHVVRANSLIDHAESLARNQRQPDERASALSMVAWALVQVDDVERARSVINDVEAVAYDTPEAEGRQSANAQLADNLVHIGDVDLARTMANPGAHWFFDAMIGVASIAAAKHEQQEAATAIAPRITDPQQRASAMHVLARSKSPAGDEANRGGIDPRWSWIAERLRATAWDDNLATLIKLVPDAAAVALNEIDDLGWRRS